MLAAYGHRYMFTLTRKTYIGTILEQNRFNGVIGGVQRRIDCASEAMMSILVGYCFSA
jgi:hypothetical protein